MNRAKQKEAVETASELRAAAGREMAVLRDSLMVHRLSAETRGACLSQANLMTHSANIIADLLQELSRLETSLAMAELHTQAYREERI